MVIRCRECDEKKDVGEFQSIQDRLVCQSCELKDSKVKVLKKVI